jgi:hypothetical protein
MSDVMAVSAGAPAREQGVSVVCESRDDRAASVHRIDSRADAHEGPNETVPATSPQRSDTPVSDPRSAMPAVAIRLLASVAKVVAHTTNDDQRAVLRRQAQMIW